MDGRQGSKPHLTDNSLHKESEEVVYSALHKEIVYCPYQREEGDCEVIVKLPTPATSVLPLATPRPLRIIWELYILDIEPMLGKWYELKVQHSAHKKSKSCLILML